MIIARTFFATFRPFKISAASARKVSPGRLNGSSTRFVSQLCIISPEETMISGRICARSGIPFFQLRQWRSAARTMVSEGAAGCKSCVHWKDRKDAWTLRAHPCHYSPHATHLRMRPKGWQLLPFCPLRTAGCRAYGYVSRRVLRYSQLSAGIPVLLGSRRDPRDR